MKKLALVLSVVAALLLAAGAQAQVATAEIQGVETTSPHSRHVSAWQLDGSVGEVRVVVRALDAGGDPVSGVPVTWRIENATTNVVFVVGASTELSEVPQSAHSVRPLIVDGGTTDENGEAYLVVDSMTAGDARVMAEAGGVDAKTYRGRDMRVVWF